MHDGKPCSMNKKGKKKTATKKKKRTANTGRSTRRSY